MLYINKGLIVTKNGYKVKDNKIYFKSKGNYYIQINGNEEYRKANRNDSIDYQSNDTIFICKTGA